MYHASVSYAKRKKNINKQNYKKPWFIKEIKVFSTLQTINRQKEHNTIAFDYLGVEITSDKNFKTSKKLQKEKKGAGALKVVLITTNNT